MGTQYSEPEEETAAGQETPNSTSPAPHPEDHESILDEVNIISGMHLVPCTPFTDCHQQWSSYRWVI